jgi:Family of unknown function (DUF6353)
MNIRKFIPNGISSAIGRKILVSQKNAPTVLFVSGVVGVIATTVVASRATLKVEAVLDETQADLEKAKRIHEANRPDYTSDDYKRDLVIIYTRATINVVKLYAPAILIGGLSIAALTGSHNMLSRRNAALTAAYAALDKGFREYRQRVVDELGEDEDRKFRYGSEVQIVREQTEDGPKFSQVARVAGRDVSVYARFFDQLCEPWSAIPEYNRLFLSCQQNYLNDMLRARGHVFLNEVYDRLGIPRTKEGSVVGWLKDGKGDGYIDFGIFDGTNPGLRDFVNTREGAVLLDFNVDGLIYDQL